jgi:host factor-I protein
MGGAKVERVQDEFLNGLRKTNTPVTVYLNNGVRLEGLITSFDQHALMLKGEDSSQLIYKHVISSIGRRQAKVAGTTVRMRRSRSFLRGDSGENSSLTEHQGDGGREQRFPAIERIRARRV